jgi:integrase
MERYKRTVIPRQKDQRNPTRHADFWIERAGNLKLSRLTPAVLGEVRDELSLDKASSTVNRYLAVMSHACSFAEREWGWLESNPMRRVKRLEEPKGRVRYLSDTERVALLSAVEGSEHPHLYPIVLIALTTGARRSEILGLRWKNVDLTKGWAVLEDTKNKERRSVTLVPQVVEQLQLLGKVRRIGNDLVFAHPKTGKPSYYYFEKAWRKARGDAQIENFRFHDLRHSCASYLAMNGATTAEIAAVLGHKTLAMVRRYSHLSDEHVRGVVERAAAKLLGDA